MPLTGWSCDAEVVRVSWGLAASAQEVWRHLTSEQHLPEWLGRVSSGGFARGGTLVVDHGEGYLCTSGITALVPDRELAMTWHFPDEPSSQLSVKVASSSKAGDTVGTVGHCRLDLRHADLGDLAASYLPGWITHLGYFESSLEGAPLPPGAFWRLHATHARLTSGSTMP